MLGETFDLAHESGAEATTSRRRHDVDLRELAFGPRQPAQTCAGHDLLVLLGHQEQAGGQGQVVTGIVPQGGVDLSRGRGPSVVPADDVLDVGPDCATSCLGGMAHHDPLLLCQQRPHLWRVGDHQSGEDDAHHADRVWRHDGSGARKAPPPGAKAGHPCARCTPGGAAAGSAPATHLGG